MGARRRTAADAGRRQAALRRAADRIETALTGLEEPLRRYLLELEAEALEGRSWYGGPGAAELLDWTPVLDRAGVRGAGGAGRAGVPRAGRPRARARGARRRPRVIEATPDRAGLWAGLFDLRDNLLGRALDDLRLLSNI